MHATVTPAQEFEIAAEDFERVFSFPIDAGLTKVVMLARKGKSFRVVIRYAEVAIFEETEESFEADGSITITETESGIYFTSCRSLLSDRIRLRRTRFF